jgi:hypothetical protein
MPARATKKWQASCTPEQFIALRTRPDFQQLVALARWANAYRAIVAAIPERPETTPAGSAGHRHKMSAILFNSALLYEGWALVKRMGQHYRTYDAWKKGFGPILKDGRFVRLVENRLGPLRSQTVFHFFEDETARRLAEHEPDGPVIFLTARGNDSLEASYDLADIIAIRTLCGDPAPTSALELFTRAEDIGAQISQLARPFFKATDELIVEALGRLGFKEQAG